MYELLISGTNDLKQIMKAQAVNANNLANASTDGFKAELAYLTSVDSLGEISSVPDMSKGTIKTTGRDLDVAINGEGWIAVIAPDGSEAYTRRGDLQIDAVGLLKNGSGQSIMGNAGPIALPPFGELEIAADGTVSILPLGQTPNTMAVVDRIKLVSIDEMQLTRGDDGLMRLPPGQEVEAAADVQLISGALEASNVNTISEMVKMIELSRRFEAQVQLMHSAKENAQSLAKIMSMS